MSGVRLAFEFIQNIYLGSDVKLASIGCQRSEDGEHNTVCQLLNTNVGARELKTASTILCADCSTQMLVPEKWRWPAYTVCRLHNTNVGARELKMASAILFADFSTQMGCQTNTGC